MSDPPRFNLVDDPWVRVRLTDGRVETLSLLGVFERSGEIRELAGDLGLQDFAVLRLVLAIAHSSLRAVDDHRPPIELWRELWTERGTLAELAVDYLDEWRDRFELFDAERPFLQVAGLTTGKDQIFPLERIIVDVPNDVDKPYFTTRSGGGLRRMSPGEAARWLVTTQAIDPSGIKSGAIGDDRVKGGKGYPIGTAPAASIGGVVIRGDDLERSLLLNLVLGDPVSGEPFEARDDAPVWELDEPLGPGVRAESAPRGPVSVLTWPSRRLRLQTEASDVVGCLVANGDPLDVSLFRQHEFMTSWRQPASDLKTTSEPVLRAVRHDADRALWRGVAALLPSPEGTQLVGGTKRQVLPAGVIAWLELLEFHKVIAADQLITVQAVGLKLDANSAIVQDVVDDDVQLVAGLLDRAQHELVDAVKKAARDTESGVYALGRLRQRIADAGGNRDTDARGIATTAGFFAVDAPFRHWLQSLRPGDDRERVLAAWHDRVRDLLVELGRDAVDEAPPSAIVGRPTNYGQMSAPIAERRFLIDLDDALPLSAAAVERRRRREERTHRSANLPKRTEAAS